MRLFSKLVEKLSRFILNSEDHYGYYGDIREIYSDIAEEKGKFAASLWYSMQLIRMLSSYFINKILWSFVMFKNYLKIALRNIKRQKVYSIINISGLAVGLACSILVLFWIYDELSFDRFFENTNELYRVIAKIPSENVTVNNARTPNALGAALVEQYPEFVDFTRYQCFENRLLEINDKSHLNNLAVGDKSFFNMFSFTFLSGDPGSCLNERYNIVLTESTAKKYFGNENPMGKTINIVLGPKIPLKVSGVIKDTPENSHLHFDCIIPFVNTQWWDADLQDWNITMFYTYVQLRKECNHEKVNEKISGIIKQHNTTSPAKIYLQPLKDIHLRSKLAGDFDNYRQGDIKYVYIYCITALCVLLIACINFMNLSTARSTRRAKELGIRKVAGARRKQLFCQFLGESIVLSVFALLLAVGFVILILPVFNNLTNKHLTADLLKIPFIMAASIGIALITGVISGSYPAFFLSAMQPVKTLKDSGLKSSRFGIFLRKSLVIIQFVLSVIFITGAFTIYNQLNFIRNKPLGFNNSNIITTHSISLGSGQSYEVIFQELFQNPNILNISRAKPPNTELFGNSTFEWEGKNPDREVTLYPISVDYSYLNTFGMTMKEGRFFSMKYGMDNNSIVINETAVKVMGLNNPIGTKVRYEIRNWETGGYDTKECSIIGIVNDFHQRSLHNSIEPMVFTLLDNELGQYSIKISPQNISETITFLGNKWKEYHPDYPFFYQFLSETIDNFYVNDRKTGAIFTYFSLLAIFISCLGLFGLVSYTAEQRKKEIGIRKVLGSSVIGITLLLSKEFLRNIVFSLVIAFPLAWFIMDKWLEEFAYRINIGISVFVISGFLTLFITMLSVGFQIFKASAANPVESIRHE